MPTDRQCADCRFSRVTPWGERRTRGWSAPCVSCNGATLSNFQPQPPHDGAWAIVFSSTGKPVDNIWCDRLGLPKPAVYPSRAEADIGAAVLGARLFCSAVDVVPFIEETSDAGN